MISLAEPQSKSNESRHQKYASVRAVVAVAPAAHPVHAPATAGAVESPAAEESAVASSDQASDQGQPDHTASLDALVPPVADQCRAFCSYRFDWPGDHHLTLIANGSCAACGVPIANRWRLTARCSLCLPGTRPVFLQPLLVGLASLVPGTKRSFRA